MKSRASLKGHPIHPMLVTFPIGLWVTSFVYDVAAAAANDDSTSSRRRQTADDMMLAGLVGALAAAVPGTIDYFAVIPSDSSAKKRGAKHGLANLGIAALYGLNLAVRQRSPERWGRWLGLPLSLIGVGGLAYSGWLGGTLVYRNQIGVDHRGPNATRFREGGALEGPAGELVTVATMDEFEKPGQMKLVHLNGHRIVVTRVEDRIAAFQDHCPHRGGPLSDGALACGVVTCPWHGSQFDVESGKVVSGPAEESIHVYPVRIEQEQVRIVAPEPLPNPTIADQSGMLPSEPVRAQIEERAKQAVQRVKDVLPSSEQSG